MINIYQLLAVREDATLSECTVAYNRSSYILLESMEINDDTNNETKCLKIKADLDDAIAIIKDPVKRKRYDEDLYWHLNRDGFELAILYYKQDVSLAYEKVRSGTKIADIKLDTHSISAFVRSCISDRDDQKKYRKYARDIILNPFTLLHISNELHEAIITKLINGELCYEDFIYSFHEFVLLFEYCPKQRIKWLNDMVNNHHRRSIFVLKDALNENINLTFFIKLIKLLSPNEKDMLFKTRSNGYHLITQLIIKDVRFINFIETVPEHADQIISHLLNIHMEKDVLFDLRIMISNLSHPSRVIFFNYCSKVEASKYWDYITQKYPDIFADYPETTTAFFNHLLLKPCHLAELLTDSKKLITILSKLPSQFKYELINLLIINNPNLFQKLFATKESDNDFDALMLHLPVNISVQSKNRTEILTNTENFDSYRYDIILNKIKVDRLNKTGKFKSIETILLYDKLNELQDYGLTLKLTFPDQKEKYENVLSLAKQIKCIVDEYCCGGITNKIASQKLNLIFNEGKMQMRQNRNVIDILAHIAICCTVIGLAVLCIRWARTGRFFLNKTEREIRLDSVKYAWKNILCYK